MDKKVFMQLLEQNLRRVSATDKEEILNYYDELIEDYKEDGCSEEEAVARLESPQDIANRATTHELPESNKLSGWVYTLLIIGFPLWGSILLAGIFLVLSFLIVIWCLPVVVVSLTFACYASAFIGIVGAFPVMLFTFLHGLLQLGIGIFFLGASYWFTQWSIKSIRYIKAMSGHVIYSATHSIREGGIAKWINTNGSK